MSKKKAAPKQKPPRRFVISEPEARPDDWARFVELVRMLLKAGTT
jgi:hypothetical protein